MLSDPTQQHMDIIGAFSYQKNKIIVHGDTSFMPGCKKSWASWIYLSEDKKDTKSSVSLSYWMNNLQPLNTDKPVMVTLNPGRRPQENLIYDEHIFSHPVFDLKAIIAQSRINEVQGNSGLWFCGAYQRYGFHEDGLVSAVNVVKKMGAPVPWE
jgi:predicted NAD/FAD-binding protein